MDKVPQNVDEPDGSGRWRRIPEQRPQQIVEAALGVFGEVGFEQARLEDVAERAGVSKGTIYNYFESKEALFEEMVRQTLAELLDFTAPTSFSEDATAALRVFMSGVWRYMRSSTFEMIYRLVLAEQHRFPQLGRMYSAEVRVHVTSVATSILERGIAAGEFRRMDTDTASRMLMALLVKHGVWCGRRERWPDLAQRSDDEVLAEVVDFYLHALRPDAEPVGAEQRRQQ